jgi:hypothetical protein
VDKRRGAARQARPAETLAPIEACTAHSSSLSGVAAPPRRSPGPLPGGWPRDPQPAALPTPRVLEHSAARTAGAQIATAAAATPAGQLAPPVTKLDSLQARRPPRSRPPRTSLAPTASTSTAPPSPPPASLSA